MKKIIGIKGMSCEHCQAKTEKALNAKMEHKQLDNCDLTFKDVTKIKHAFVQILVGYYHSRIEYPDQQDPDKAAEKKDEK